MTEAPHRHVILVSGSVPSSKSIAAVMSGMRMMNAIPMLISDHHLRLRGTEDAEAINQQVLSDLARSDGVILMGNDMDIDPKDYADDYRHPETRSERDIPEGCVRAAYEYALVGGALEQKKPLFGVCGGMQRINVHLKGTLHQHLPDIVGTAYHHQGDMGIAPFIPVQYVGVVPGTKLATIGKEIGGIFTPQHEKLPPGVFMENSFHHQAVDQVGEGLIPCAFSIEPGKQDLHIVQAIEADAQGPYKDQFVLGVQWHPEFGASDLSMRTLQNFNAAAQLYAKANARQVSQEEILAITASSMMGDKSRWESLTVDWSKTLDSALSNKSKKPTRGR